MRILPIITALTVFLFISRPAMAQQAYVADVQEITVRTGPSLENKIVQLVKSGSRLEKLKEEGEWAQVRTENGKDGWVLKRYLSAETPVKVQFEEFKARNADMIEKAGKVEAIIGKYEEESKALQQRMASLKADYEKVKSDFDALSRANADVAEMTRSYREIKAASEAARQEADQLRRRNESLQDLSDVKWFLAGAGVLFAGWLFGYLLGRSSRKKSNRMYL
ncbi:MAG: TIGR04211 family SH3 domain-containing protein [Thermodesulfobacteriota bacterium]